ncbi:plasmid mobilization protein [Anaerococcus sp.]|uniref:plasmid mobilization protein n=1 Tax=Anaerococcus sp. TaxID=1872515 RepID=UPI0028FEDB67|nr:hypothetical protein [Anaerococcus sp.]MDU2599806.1 hypothetical protein [Anaerococcus sp.]
MANRFRNERIEIKLTKEEKEVFKKKMKLTNCKTMSHFLRKCVLEKEIWQIHSLLLNKSKESSGD